jgi:hypothetical protein
MLVDVVVNAEESLFSFLSVEEGNEKFPKPPVEDGLESPAFESELDVSFALAAPNDPAWHREVRQDQERSKGG